MKRKGFYFRDVTKLVDTNVEVIRDSYWLCKNGDEKQALMFNNAPQCNKNQKITEHLLRDYPQYQNKELKVTFIDLAFIPQRD